MMKSVILMMMALIIAPVVMSKNPLKTSLLILLTSGMGFLVVKAESGGTWFPLILFMLFTGGILMMFMILSSILPNEKSLKVKFQKSSLTMFLMITLYMSVELSASTKESIGEIKAALSSPLLYSVMLVLILLYFFLSMNLNQMESSPLRTVQCC